MNNSLIDITTNYLNENMSSKRFEWRELFALITKLVSYRSSCAKTRQAALLIKDDRILSIGVNGPPAGSLNCIYEDEKICGKDSSGSCFLGVHAETNCIAYAARNGICTDGCKMYITQSPCINCSKLILSAGINNIYFLEYYRKTEGLEFLKMHNVQAEKL